MFGLSRIVGPRRGSVDGRVVSKHDWLAWDKIPFGIPEVDEDYAGLEKVGY